MTKIPATKTCSDEGGKFNTLSEIRRDLKIQEFESRLSRGEKSIESAQEQIIISGQDMMNNTKI